MNNFRAFLEKLYLYSGYLSAICLIGLLIMVIVSIFGRFLPIPSQGVDAYAGYFMAASGFLAMAHTLRKREHIRVTLFLQRLSKPKQKILEIYCHIVGVLISGLLFCFSLRLVWQSHQFHDISQSLDATPLYIPQSFMAIGAGILLIAFIDETIDWLKGTPRIIERSEEVQHIE